MASRHVHELPDHDLNMAVAEHIMGWRWVTDSTGCNSYFYSPAMIEWSLKQREPGTLGKAGPAHPSATKAVPDYANQIPAAWSVVEKLRELGWLVNLRAMPDGYPFLLDDEGDHKLFKRYYCSLMWVPHHDTENLRKRINTHPWAHGDTPGQAVCRVALESIDWGRQR